MTKEELEYYLAKEYGENGFPSAATSGSMNADGTLTLAEVEVRNGRGEKTSLDVPAFNTALRNYVDNNPIPPR